MRMERDQLLKIKNKGENNDDLIKDITDKLRA